MKDLNTRAFAWRGIVAAVVGGSVMFGSSMVARADDVANSIDASVDAEAEVMNLNAGGPTKSTQLIIKTANSDGKNGCNLTGSTMLSVDVKSSNTAVATVSPDSVTFTSCGDEKTITVTPVAGGTASVSLTETSNTTGATFNLAPATFTVNVAPATPTNTPPTVKIEGVTAGASYEYGAVPAASCSVTDAQDGNSSFAAELSAISGPLAGFGLGSRTANCSYTDQGGLIATASAAYSIVDTGAPVIKLVSRTPGANANGWNNTDVTVEWSCTDAVSGVAADTVIANVKLEGANQDATGTCTDGAGNKATATEKVSIDNTAPAIAFESRTPAGPGWSTERVVVTWTCTDALSGVVAPTVSTTVESDGADQSATGTCTDKSGNTSTSAPVGDIDVDQTPPTITLKSRTPANANDWNNTGVTVVWECKDDVSGVAAETITKTLGMDGANQSLTGTCTDGAGNEASATETNINIDKTAPGTTFVSRNPEGDGWTNQDVVVTWSCTDALSGAEDASVTKTVSTEGANQTATGTCTDLAGNTADDTQDGINIDKTAPKIEYTSRSVTGWTKEPVTVTWSCTDALSGAKDASVTKTVSTEGANQTATATCIDLAGNTADDTQDGINIDKTAPVTTFVSRNPEGDSWTNQDVVVTWSCTDALSGAKDASVTKTVSTEGANQKATGTCTDLSGNTADDTQDGINIDKTAPSVHIVGGPVAGANYPFGSVPPAPTCSASDALAGLSGECSITGYKTAVGMHTITAVATDLAGNASEESLTYTVEPWTIKGFYQPVDMNGVWNTVKGGSTVPLKFEVFAGSTELTNPVIATFSAKGVTCGAALADDIEVMSTGGTSLRYDSAGGQFIQNWQTPKNAGACYRVTMTTTDGSSISALFKLK
jgi:hypothetical protein